MSEHLSEHSRSHLTASLLGFSGLGGLKWVASVLGDRTPAVPEDLTPDEVTDPACDQVMVAGRPVVCYAEGRGEPALVFLHGFGESLQVWEPIQQALAKGRQTLALDLWGFGASVRPPDITPRDWVGEVTGLMDAMGLKQAVLVGHSLGARVALMTARAQPQRVRGLVLCNADWGQARFGYIIAFLLCRLPLLDILMGKLRANKGHLWRLLEGFGTPSFQPGEAGLEAWHRPLRVQGTVQAWRHLGSAPPLRDVRGLLDAVHCPALVIHGEEDPIVPLGAGAKLARKLKAELRTIPQCGHFAPEEYPAAVTEMIEEFVRTL